MTYSSQDLKEKQKQMYDELRAAKDLGYIQLWYTHHYEEPLFHTTYRKQISLVFNDEIGIDQIKKLCDYIGNKYTPPVFNIYVESVGRLHRLHISLMEVVDGTE